MPVKSAPGENEHDCEEKNVLTTVLVAILLLVLITFMFLRNLGIIAGCIKLIALE